MKTMLAVAVALMFLALTITLSVHEWRELGGADIGNAGYIALVFGTIVATLLGGGLMGLIFVSSRSGLDEAVANETTEQPDDARR